MEHCRSALIVTRLFAPEAAVGVHRVTGLCRHLAEGGRWRVTVVTGAPRLGAPVDEGLLADVPDSVRVVQAAAPELPLLAARLLKRARGPKAEPPPQAAGTSTTGEGEPQPGILRRWIDWASWWLQVPDTQTGWLLPAVWAGWRESRRQRPDVIFTTAPLWSAHVAGAMLSHWLRVPLVADFRDPWTGSTFRPIPYAAHRRLNAWLERRVVARASHITCAWDGIRQYMAARYPRRADIMTTILNGFDPDILDAVPARRLDATGPLFVHAGGFYGPRSPLPLLEALRWSRMNGQPISGTFALIGPGSYNGQALRDLAADYGVPDAVRVVPRVPHRDALGLVKGADAAMLFGQSGDEALASIPAKAYEYIGLGKPVLAIGAGQEVCDVMRRGGCPVWAVPADDLDAIAKAIDEIGSVIAGTATPPMQSCGPNEPLTRARMAQYLERELLAAVGSDGKKESTW